MTTSSPFETTSETTEHATTTSPGVNAVADAGKPDDKERTPGSGENATGASGGTPSTVSILASPPATGGAEQPIAPNPVANTNAPRTDTAPQVPPEVEGLRAMFPDLDIETLQSVLASVDGNQERAADLLLGMSDPNYVSQERGGPTQAELDEQLARRLLMEEHQQQGYDPNWNQQQAYYGPQGGRWGGRGQVPYQPRVHGQGHGNWQGRPDGHGGQGGGGDRDTMADVQESLKNFAETGKKTFSSLFSKVKAKVQEFDQNRQSQNPAPSAGAGSGSSRPNWGGGPVGGGRSDNGSQPNEQRSSQFHYQPSSQGETQGYDLSGAPPPNPTKPSEPPRENALGLSSSPSSTAGAPRPPSAGIDPSKIGLLPKRPVSLMGTTPANDTPNSPTSPPCAGDFDKDAQQARSTNQPQPNTRRADEEELDYVENPFDERDTRK